MNELTLVEQAGQYWADSREVATMVDKEHKNLMADIRSYIDNMEKSGELNFQPSSFFQESSYVSAQNKKIPYYLISRKGCDFVGNKMTGTKGTLFTAAYINKFHEMESKPRVVLPTETELLIQLLQDKVQKEKQMAIQSAQITAIDKRMDNTVKEMAIVKDKLDNINQHSEHYTVLAFGKKCGYSLPLNDSARLGKMATALSKESGILIGKVPDPRFGVVNTYHASVLEILFIEEGLIELVDEE